MSEERVQAQGQVAARAANGREAFMAPQLTAGPQPPIDRRFQQLIEYSSEHIALINEQGKILYANAVEPLLGYSLAEYVRFAPGALLHPDDLPKAQAFFQMLLALPNATRTIEVRSRHQAGHYIWIEVTATNRLHDPDVQAIVANSRDITRRKQSEAADREQRQFAEALRDSLVALTSSLDVERVMQQLLDAAAKVVPSEAGSIILFEGEEGRVAYLRGFTPAAAAFWQDYRFALPALPYGNVRTTRQPYCVADTQAAPDWVTVPHSAWIRSSLGVPIALREQVIGVLVVDSAIPHHFRPADMEKLQAFPRYASLALDNAYQVTQLEQQVGGRTAELQAAKERVEAILNHSLDAIVLVQSDLRIQQTNAAFQRLFAYAPADSVARSLCDLLHAADVARVNAVIQTAIREQVGQQVEMRCYRKNGTLFEAELSLGPITATDNGTDGLVCTIRDITARKQAQNALAEERNLLRTLIDALPDIIYMKDTDHRTVLTNMAGARSFGVTSEEIVGKDNFAFVPAEMARQFHMDEDRLFQSGLPLIDHEERTLGQGGKVIWASTTKVPLRNLQGALIGLVGITRDISKQKERERELRYYASLQENVNDAVIATDLELRIQSWNRAAQLIYGWRAEEVLGQAVGQVLQTRYASVAARERQLQALLDQGWWQGEVVQRRQDGTALAIWSSVTLLKDEQGLAYGLVAVNHDISERKRAAEALHEQRDFLQLVIDSLPHLIMIKDRAGRFQMVNERAAHTYNVTSAAIVGKTDGDLNPNLAEVAFFHQKDQETLASGQPIFIPEEPLFGCYYQTSKIPLKNPAGQYDRLLVVASDITARKQAEKALRQALEQEKELGELKSRFVSMASHELRTPLASILAMTETLHAYRHKLANDQIAERLEDIIEQVHHLTDIMEDMLQLARLQARWAEFNPVRLDLAALCRSVLDEFQSQPDIKHRLVFRDEAGACEAALDKKLMRQIISNLVSNAIKYSPVDKTILVSLQATGAALVLQVRDEGIGIPAADLNHLFQPFHRAANVGTIAGTGLGLTIVKESVEQHGGTITVESQVGAGTTFTVSIPIAASEEKNTVN